MKMENKEKDKYVIKRRTNILSILIAIGAVLLFIFTENVRLPMTLVDQWTPLMIILAIVGIVIFILTNAAEAIDVIWVKSSSLNESHS